jgi:tryptophan synthase alpha chain
MNRIDRIFTELRQTGGKALMPFITAGYPCVEATAALLPAMEQAGASICELGIPFSDPIADGPVIQASMTEALARGITVEQVFAAVRGVREQVGMGLVSMVSYSIIYRHGVRQFVKEAKEAGFDGFILPDVPVDESAEVGELIRDAGLTCSLLIAPTTSPHRAERIAQACSGFVYVVARTGITGEQANLPAELSQRVQQLRTMTDLPIAVGFGISKAEHVRAVTEVADAAIVGSAVVRHISQCADSPPQAIAEHVGQFIGELATGLPRI